MNPGDSSVDPQGAAVEDLGEAGSHLQRREAVRTRRAGQRAAGLRAAGGGRTLTCTLGVGGSPWQDDLWEGRRSQDHVPGASPLPVPLWPPHLRILPVFHGGPGGGERRGAVGARERAGWGSCKHRPRANSRPAFPPTPSARTCFPVPELGLTWGAGQRGLSWGLMWARPQRGPLDGSHGIVWGVQLLGGGASQLSAGPLVNAAPSTALCPPRSSSPPPAPAVPRLAGWSGS